MSDQTPETSLEATEPSMEDILASIRKIIADDDAPVHTETSAAVSSDLELDNFASEDLTATNLENSDAQAYGNISDLVELRSQPPQLAQADIEPLADSNTQMASDTVIDLEIEDFDADTVLTDSNPTEDMPQILPDTALTDVELVDIDMPKTVVADKIASEAELEASDLTDLGASDLDLTDFDLDAEFADLENLEYLEDLEIPTPDPVETVMADAQLHDDLPSVEAVSANFDGDNVTRPDMAQIASAGALASGGTVAGGAAMTAFGEARNAVNTDDIDAALSALLDTTNPSEEETPQITETHAVSDELDLTDEASLDHDLTAMLDDVALAEDVVETPETEAVSDDELDTLLQEMSLDADSSDNLAPKNSLDESLSDETSEHLGDDYENIDAIAVDNEEDPDLLLVKSLMADLADYNAEDAAEEGSNPLDGLANDQDEVYDDMSGDIAEAALASDIPDDMDEDDTVILDEILNMTLDDELAAQNAQNRIPTLENTDDVAALERDNLAENLELDSMFDAIDAEDVGLDTDVVATEEAIAIDAMLADMIAPQAANMSDAPDDSGSHNTDVETPSSKGLSLSDIAAAAQADADETTGFGAILAGVGATAIGAASVASATLDPSDDANDDIHALTQFDEDAAMTPIEAVDDNQSSEEKTGQDDVDRILAKLLNDDRANQDEDEDHDDIGESEAENVAMNDTPEHARQEILVQEATNASESLNLSETSQEITQMPRAATKNSDVIMDDMTEAATASVFAELNQVVEEKAIVAERGDRVGDLVMEALRPMLKDWLDANLKGIVERAVTKEVKRISSGK